MADFLPAYTYPFRLTRAAVSRLRGHSPGCGVLSAPGGQSLKRLAHLFAGGAMALLMTLDASAARPIGFARSTNLMVDYREDTMSEAQIFYAPEHWYSFGLGYSELATDFSDKHYINSAALDLVRLVWTVEQGS